MVKILGLPFDDYVDKQVKTRQAKLAKTQRSPEDLSVFNSNTAWVRLSSGVKVEPERAETLSTKLGIGKSSIEGTALARNLVLWGGVSSFSTGSSSVSLDPIKGGIGYGLNNTYGFLSNAEQGLKPPPGITSITCNYKNNGSLKQATVSMKCYTRSQFEAIEAVYLRLGYTMILEWGNTLWFNNDGEFKQTQAYSIPNILFKDQNDVNPETIFERLAFNKKATACNYDGMLAKVTNYSWTIGSDLSFDIKLDLISTGDIIDSLKVNIGGTNTQDLTGLIKITGSLENIAAIQVNKEASKLNGFFYELYDEVFKPLLKEYGSAETQKQIENLDKTIEAVPLLDEIKKKYKPVLDEFRTYIQAFNDGLQIYEQATIQVRKDINGNLTPLLTIRPEDQTKYTEVAKKLGVETYTLNSMYFDKENEKVGVKNFETSLNAIETYFNTLKSSPDTADAITYLEATVAPSQTIIEILSSGTFSSSDVEVSGGRWRDGNPVYLGDKKFSNIMQDLFEGLDVG